MTESKAVQVVTTDIKATKTDSGSYDITMSVPTEDRDGEVIDGGALQWLSKGRMPVDVDHGMTVLSTVGSGLPAYEGDDLKLEDFRFASTPFAQDVKTLVDEGHISKMSVAFMAADREVDEKDGRVHIRSGELLNAAIVAIPSNREANILVSKALEGLADRLEDAKVGARNSAKDAELIQTMHDSAASLGAVCNTTTRDAGPSDTKSPVITNPEDTAADEAAVEPPAEVDVAKALTELALVEADLALE